MGIEHNEDAQLSIAVSAIVTLAFSALILIISFKPSAVSSFAK